MKLQNIFMLAGAGVLIMLALFSASDSKLVAIEDRPLFGGEILDTGNEKTYLYDIKEGVSYGMASRAYSGKVFIHIVSADIEQSNQSDYKVWLKDPGTSESIETGQLVKVDGEHISVYQSDKDLRRFSQVIIGDNISDPLLLGAY